MKICSAPANENDNISPNKRLIIAISSSKARIKALEFCVSIDAIELIVDGSSNLYFCSSVCLSQTITMLFD